MAMGLGIGIGMQFSGGSVAVNPITALSPTAYWPATQGYYSDGCIQIGKGPHGVGSVNNWLSSTSGTLAAGVAGLSGSAWFCIDADIAVNQTIASKGTAAKFEWELTWSRTTGFITFKPYALNGASSASATSTVACAVGTWYHVSWFYNSADSKAYISVNNETPVASSGTVTIGSSDGAFRIGSWFNSTQNLEGRVDNFGISIGSDWCYAQRVALYNSGSGARYEDLSSPTLTAWWDFGNLSTNSTGVDPTDVSYDRNNLTAWDWLVDAVAGLTLTQATSGATYPYISRGFTSPLRATATTKKVLGWTDFSGNGYDCIQPWFGLRPSFDPTGIDGGPAWYFDGIESLGINDYCGQVMHNFPVGKLLSGDVSYSFVAIIKYKDPWHATDQVAPVDDLLGTSICGAGNNGWLPWGTYTAALASLECGFVNRFQLSTTYEPILDTLGLKYHWYSLRESDDTKQNRLGDTYRGSIDSEKHAVGFHYDATTHVTKMYLDGIEIFSVNQTADNIGGGGSVGTMTLNAFTIGDGDISRDEQIVPGATPSAAFGSAGWCFYGWMSEPAVWVGGANRTFAEIQQLTIDLNPDYAATATSKAFCWPPYQPTHWWDPSSQTYQEKTRALAETRAVANNDPVGAWLARTGTAAGDAYIANADANRPLLQTNYANGLPVILADGVSDYLACTLSRAQPFTVYMVMKISGLLNAYHYWWCSPGQAEIISMNNTTQWQAYLGAGSPKTDPNQGNFRVMAFVCNNASSKVYMNGVDMSATVSGTLAIVGTMHLFTYNGSQYFSNIHLGEHIVDNSAHDAAKVLSMSQWMMAMYGIT